MLAVVLCLIIIWLFIIQAKLMELSDTLKELKTHIIKDKLNSNLETVKANTYDNYKNNIQETEEQPLIENITEEIVPSAAEQKLPEYIENKLKDKTEKSFENIFLGNVFNKVGALAILIGLIILIKIVSPYFVFTPELKITLGYLAGIVMTIWALKIHYKENLKNFSEVLLGTGFGAMFISTYCASALFNLFNMPVTITVATALLLAAFYLADKLKTVSMLVISLIAAYINPIFFNSEFTVFPDFMFGYFIFINLLSIIFTYRNSSRSIINTINLCITFLASLIYCKDINIAGPIILWASYITYDMITRKISGSDKILNYLNFFVFIGTLLNIYPDEHKIIGYCALGCTFVYALITYLIKSDREVFKNYLQVTFIAALIFVYFICENDPSIRCYIWTAEAVILCYFAYRYRFKIPAAWAVGVWGAAYCSMLPVDGVFAIKNISGFVPVWNIRLAMFAPVIISSAVSYLFLKKSDKKSLLNLSEFFNFACITSIYLYIGLELNNIINFYYMGINTSSQFISNMTNSILGFVYTVNLKRFQKTISDSSSIISVIAFLTGIFALTILIFSGSHYKPIDAYIPLINIRTAAFLSGVAASILYAKWTQKQIFKYFAIILGFIFVHYEIVDVISKYVITNGSYLVSLSWILYSGIVTAVGIIKNKNYLKNCGIGLCILSIIRIFLYDLANIDMFYKFIAILSLGIILMILSYLYNKKIK